MEQVEARQRQIKRRNAAKLGWSRRKLREQISSSLPRFRAIDLRKSTDIDNNRMTDHPDIKTDGTMYFIKWDGRYFTGTFHMQWYGLNFSGVYDAGVQFDAPGFNSSKWEAIWEIIEK